MTGLGGDDIVGIGPVVLQLSHFIKRIIQVRFAIILTNEPNPGLTELFPALDVSLT